MTPLKTDLLSLDLPGECWKTASEIVPPGNAFTEEFWNAASRQMLTGLILHVAITCPLDKRTVETLLKIVEGGVEQIAAIRANTVSGAVRAWLHPAPAEADHHYTAAILAECAANLHRFLL
jgi:hypothetical protein